MKWINNIVGIIDNDLRRLSKFERANRLFLLRNEARKVEQSVYFMLSMRKSLLYNKLTKLYKKYSKIGLL